MRRWLVQTTLALARRVNASSPKFACQSTNTASNAEIATPTSSYRVCLLTTHLFDDRLKRRQRIRQRRHIRTDMQHHRVEVGIANKWLGTCKHFVEQNTQALNVRPRINIHAARLFGAQVVWAPGHRARHRQVRLSVQFFCNAKVGQQQSPVRAGQDIRRFQIGQSPYDARPPARLQACAGSQPPCPLPAHAHVPTQASPTTNSIAM